MDRDGTIYGTRSEKALRPSCLVAGCTCKDARIVSRRRAAFFATWAREHGETADRAVAPEAGWRIPTLLPSAF
mgnify:CR=1 FL=1